MQCSDPVLITVSLLSQNSRNRTEATVRQSRKSRREVRSQYNSYPCQRFHRSLCAGCTGQCFSTWASVDSSLQHIRPWLGSLRCHTLLCKPQFSHTGLFSTGWMATYHQVPQTESLLTFLTSLLLATEYLAYKWPFMYYRKIFGIQNIWLPSFQESQFQHNIEVTIFLYFIIWCCGAKSAFASMVHHKSHHRQTLNLNSFIYAIRTHVCQEACTVMLVEHACSEHSKEDNGIIQFLVFYSEMRSSTFAHSQVERLLT